MKAKFVHTRLNRVRQVERDRVSQQAGIVGQHRRELAELMVCETVMVCFLNWALPLWAQMLLPLQRDWPYDNFHLPSSSLSAPRQCSSSSLRDGGGSAAEARGWLKVSIRGCFSSPMLVSFTGLADIFFFARYFSQMCFWRKVCIPKKWLAKYSVDG